MNRFVAVLGALCLAQQAAVAQGFTSQAASQNDAVVSPSVSTTPSLAPSDQNAPAPSVAPAAVVTEPVGPTESASRAGIAPLSSKDANTQMMPMVDQHMGAGQNIALMVVGGAALVTGLLIGGGAGAAVAIGGAAIGLVGLYGYVK